MRKTKALKLTGGFLMLISLIQLFLVPIAQAAVPRFNIYTPYVHTKTAGHDYYLLDVKNNTKGTDWGFPVSADPGDTLMFSLYYHNGGVETVAYNTTLRIYLPSGTASNHTVTGYLWADNAENATASNPMSQSVTINLSSSARLELVSGSVKWYSDQKDWRYDSPTPLPFSQSGSELFGSGLRIGDIYECWEFSGYINFQVRVTGGVSVGSMSLVKKVENLTRPNGTVYDNEASVGDTLRYTLEYRNTGNTSLYDVEIIDTLAAYTAFVSTETSGFYDSGDNSIFWTIGSLAPGASGTVAYRVRVQSVPTSGTIIANTALMMAEGINDVISNETRTRVLLPTPAPPAPPPAPAVKGVKAVTGVDSLTKNLIYSLLITASLVMVVYLGLKHADYLRLLKLKLAILKIRVKERF